MKHPHTIRIEAMLKALEQTFLDVGHVKTRLQHAMNTAHTSAQIRARRDALEPLYPAAVARQKDAKNALEKLLSVGFGHATAAALIADFDAAIEGLKTVESTAVEESKR